MCYLAIQENDKQRFIIKYGRLPEAFVALIIGFDASKSNDALYNVFSVKMNKILSAVIAFASFTAAFVDLLDYVNFMLANGTHIFLSVCSLFHLMLTWCYSKNK
jgi:hypothetical protein